MKRIRPEDERAGPLCAPGSRWPRWSSVRPPRAVCCRFCLWDCRHFSDPGCTARWRPPSMPRLAENIPGHRLNTRTVYLNPALEFIYSNMKCHVEHHMFPMVPFCALPALHEEIKADCPPAHHGVAAACREMIPAQRQLSNLRYFVRRELFHGAGPPHPAAAALNQSPAFA